MKTTTRPAAFTVEATELLQILLHIRASRGQRRLIEATVRQAGVKYALAIARAWQATGGAA